MKDRLLSMVQSNTPRAIDGSSGVLPPLLLKLFSSKWPSLTKSSSSNGDRLPNKSVSLLAVQLGGMAPHLGVVLDTRLSGVETGLDCLGVALVGVALGVDRGRVAAIFGVWSGFGISLFETETREIWLEHASFPTWHDSELLGNCMELSKGGVTLSEIPLVSCEIVSLVVTLALLSLTWAMSLAYWSLFSLSVNQR